MAITAHAYDNGVAALYKGEIALESDTIKAAIVETAYTPDQGAHDFWSDVSANEASAPDYTAGGATLANVAVTVDAANHEVEVDADDVSWAGPTYATGYYIVIYKDTTVAATSPLIAYIDLGADTTVSGITFAAEGFLKSTQS